MEAYKSSPQLSFDEIEGFARESPHITPTKPTAQYYADLTPDQIDIEEAAWFREHFVGNNYITLIGSMKPPMYQHNLPLIEPEKRRNSKSLIHSILSNPPPPDPHDPFGFISVLEETSKDENSAIVGIQYRIIIRNKDVNIMHLKVIM